MKHQFGGTGVALVTPFTANVVNYEALYKLIDHVIDGGVNYLVALGTTAETPTLTDAEKQAILKAVVTYTKGRVPVVCGIGGNNTAEVLETINTYDLSDVAGLLAVGPYYNKPTQEGYYQHFKAIAEATDKPIILYNVPGRTGSNIAAATSLRLAHEFKNIVAIKEASGNLAQCMELVAGAPEGFAVLSGDDDLILPQIALGMQGVISVAANCFTKDFTSMVNHALVDNYVPARNLHYKLIDGIRLLFVEGNPAGVKCVLQHMMIVDNSLRLPLVPVSPATNTSIKAYLDSMSQVTY